MSRRIGKFFCSLKTLLKFVAILVFHHHKTETRQRQRRRRRALSLRRNVSEKWTTLRLLLSNRTMTSLIQRKDEEASDQQHLLLRTFEPARAHALRKKIERWLKTNKMTLQELLLLELT